MKKYNILVTGVGAIIGYGIIKSLRKSKYEVNIIGMDIYADAIGRYWCDSFIQAIPANSEEYIDFILDLIEAHKIDLVMFGTEQEILKINENRERLTSIMDKFVINKSKLINLAQDKWKTHRYLKENKMDAIESSISYSYEDAKAQWGIPFLLKPRTSYASKGIVKIYEYEEFEFWKKKNGLNFMVQEIIGDDNHEYTVGIFGFGNGESVNSICFQRKLSQEGATAKAKVYCNEQLEKKVKRLTEIFQPIGPTNYQFRLHKGKYLLLEINPRISSSTSLRTAFNYNEAEMCIEYFLEKKIPEQKELKYGSAVRYIEDWVEVK